MPGPNSRNRCFAMVAVFMGLLFGVICPATLLASTAVPLPKIEGPIPNSATSHVWNGAAWQWKPINLKSYGYVEEEYYVSGTANVYEAIPHSDFKTKVLRSGPYTTRIVVRRPIDMKDWSGVAAVEIINMTAGYDWTANWGALWESIINRRDVYVGITSKPNIFPGLVKFDAKRYGRLSMANPLPPEKQICGSLPGDKDYDPNLSKLYENGLAFDIFSQVGALLKSSNPANPLGSPAQRAYLMGESQSGRYIKAYYSWIRPLATMGNGKRVYDGYLIEDIPMGRSKYKPLNQCAQGFSEDDPQYKQFKAGSDPLVVLNSEWFWHHDSPANSNTKDNKLWIWMVAGASHGWTWQYDYSDASYDDLLATDMFDPKWPHFICSAMQPEINLYMFEKAMYEHLDNWLLTDTPPPAAPEPELKNKNKPVKNAWGTYIGHGEFKRDANGNIRGGLRMPEMDVPIASYTGFGALDPDCSNAVKPFDSKKLAKMYESNLDYYQKYRAATMDLVKKGFLLKEDADKLLSAAASRPIVAPKQ